MIKYSRQREAIVQYLTGRTDHPSAESVYQALRQTHPNISLGTEIGRASCRERV